MEVDNFGVMSYMLASCMTVLMLLASIFPVKVSNMSGARDSHFRDLHMTANDVRNAEKT